MATTVPAPSSLGESHTLCDGLRPAQTAAVLRPVAIPATGKIPASA